MFSAPLNMSKYIGKNIKTTTKKVKKQKETKHNAQMRRIDYIYKGSNLGTNKNI